MMARPGREGQRRRGDANDADWLLDWLLIGNKSAADERFLERNGIQSVLSCCERTVKPSRIESALPDSVRTCVLPLRDLPEEQLQPFLQNAWDFLAEAKAQDEKCLIHLYAGSSRSCAIALSYLIGCEGLPLRDAWERLCERRPGARPNRGFAQQLIDLDRAVHGCTSVTLAEMGFDEPQVPGARG
ncbi:unnamed protein product [Durusdinium trenchii]|uniref:Protein-tyrosine-phosphatase n=1 Tax=Durusdinium trenchii TaxID=1381693 RepID=A0ABP0ST84_9DINO